jgi:ABC-type transporter Mla MlaB component
VPARGVVRLLNTAGGRALCLAGEVDPAAVDSFLQRYGREPVRIDRIDAGSVTALSVAGRDLLLDHLDAARQSGRTVTLVCSPPVERLLGVQGRGTSANSGRPTSGWASNRARSVVLRETDTSRSPDSSGISGWASGA